MVLAFEFNIPRARDVLGNIPSHWSNINKGVLGPK